MGGIVMWIVRSRNGSLLGYKNKPIKKDKFGTWVDFVDEDSSPICIWRDVFPEVKWEDSEPTELILK